MRSVYGKECEKHPELAGRRYLPNNNCIKCHSESMKAQHAKRKKAQQARDERLAKLETLLADILESGEWYTSALEFDYKVNGHELRERIQNEIQ